jgi:glyoxylase-like metal-dependent hydrolase (beta-lactamase superfamily II)
VRKAGVDPGDLALILHTHAHWDHCGAARQLRQTLNVPIAVHRADAERMRRGSNGTLRPSGLSGALYRPFLDWPFPSVEPDLLLDDETDLRPFGLEGRVFRTPGHTSGSVSVLLPGGEAIVGDLLMGGYFGGRLFTRRPLLHYFAEDIPLVRASIRQLIDQGAKTVFLGHGGPLSADAIRKQFGLESTAHAPRQESSRGGS